ncbi:MAG: restriction endonuclease subunit S [Leadbetterella sp.]|jgi:type I restriction enzyme S subunit|nr:restriction endonuclease subunit S [Leadbetterella sp.]
MKSNYRPLGKYIRELNERNSDLSIKKLLGVSMEKTFIPSVANLNGVDMSVYKVLRNEQLACKLMSVGRDEKLPVDLYNDDQPALVSSAYYVFEPKNKEELLPEYLMMWLCRPENDRFIGFISGGDVRGGISWETFCSLPIKVPSISKQREIVKEYNVIQNRIALNQKLIQKLEETAQAIYNEWFVDGIDLENLPLGWHVGEINDLCEYSNQKVSINEVNLDNYISTENMLQNRAGVVQANSTPTKGSVTKFEIGNILISNIRPYFKKIWLSNFTGGCSNDVLCFVPKKNIPSLYLYQILGKDNFFEYVMAGSKGTKMPRGDKKWIMNYPVIIPDNALLEKFNNLVTTTKNYVSIKILENEKLAEIKNLLLSKLATIEN